MAAEARSQREVLLAFATMMLPQIVADLDPNRLIAGATHAVFVAIVPLAALVLALSILLPEQPRRTTAPGD